MYNLTVTLNDEAAQKEFDLIAAEINITAQRFLKNGKFSSLFFMQLARLQMEGKTHISSIWEAVKAHDNGQPSLMKKPGDFTRESYLKGLWHIHYFQPQYLIKNMKQEFLRTKSGLAKKAVIQEKKFFNGEITVDEFAMSVANTCTIDALTERGKRNNLTGEWIIGTTFDNTNYYLFLTTHDSDPAENAANLLACLGEFPELNDHLNNPEIMNVLAPFTKIIS